jgi:glycine cleavage system regulatory protein
MQHSLVFTFICNDKPGIVDQLSKIVANHNGNWQESRMTKLAGKFTGIVQISVDEQKLDALKGTLTALSSATFAILIDDITPETTITDLQIFYVSILGLDRPGIVREVAQALAEQNINVRKMHSVIESAPMTGEPLFKAEVEVEAPNNVDFDTLNEQLEKICTQLDIELTLSKTK